MFRRVIQSGAKGGQEVMKMPVRHLYPPYHRHLVAPARERINPIEKAFWGFFIALGMLATPAWVLVHLDEYKGKGKK